MKLRFEWLSELVLQIVTVAAVPLTIVVVVLVSRSLSTPTTAGVDTPGHSATCGVCRLLKEPILAERTTARTRARAVASRDFRDEVILPQSVVRRRATLVTVRAALPAQ